MRCSKSYFRFRSLSRGEGLLRGLTPFDQTILRHTHKRGLQGIYTVHSRDCDRQRERKCVVCPVPEMKERPNEGPVSIPRPQRPQTTTKGWCARRLDIVALAAVLAAFFARRSLARRTAERRVRKRQARVRRPHRPSPPRALLFPSLVVRAERARRADGPGRRRHHLPARFKTCFPRAATALSFADLEAESTRRKGERPERDSFRREGTRSQSGDSIGEARRARELEGKGVARFLSVDFTSGATVREERWSFRTRRP